ncbi:hypothetical protein CPB83DRAFT_854040 [Crepidotus variabilis]|uniref:NAD(P)-binding protein n=1 Tax=Crepidotus variabilis TaxID=179855 RepID=A0A9P6EH71_9AGAR|nr:hypothetical protein CPB83DRAFT_854040 [Crepidotus variabilis]
MVSLASIKSSNVNAATTLPTRPVALFVGGTSGIGEGMARALARHTNGNADIIIVGRNKDAAQGILSSLPLPEPGTSSTPSPTPVTREFIQCDVTRMKNVHTATQHILSKYSKLNYLIISTGILTLAGREETEEGIDKKLAVHYYARWKFIRDLLPLLDKAKVEDGTGSVMSVLVAGRGGEINADDLGLKKTFSLKNAAVAAPTYNDLMMESFSEKHPSLSLIHSHPGFIRTPIAANSPSLLIQGFGLLMSTLLRPFTSSVEDCAEYMWHGMHSTMKEAGAWRIDASGDDLGKMSYHGDENQREKLWEHTEAEVEAALKK